MKKIAIVTEDGQRVSSHFGQAPFFQVFSVNEGQVTAEEQRQKPYNIGHHHHHEDHDHQQNHHHHVKGAQMFAVIADCQVLISGGMGKPAFQKAAAAGLEVFLAGGKIQDVLQAYLRGDLASDERRIHAH